MNSALSLRKAVSSLTLPASGPILAPLQRMRMWSTFEWVAYLSAVVALLGAGTLYFLVAIASA
jgi:hypothetical protein